MSTPPAPTGPRGSWAKASSYGKSGGGGGSSSVGSPYGGKGGGNDDGKYELMRQQQKEIADLKQQLAAERVRNSDLVEELDVKSYWLRVFMED